MPGVGGTSQQILRLFPTGELVGRDDHYVAFATLTGDQDRGAAIHRLIEVAGEVLAEVGVGDVVHCSRFYMAVQKIVRDGARVNAENARIASWFTGTVRTGRCGVIIGHLQGTMLSRGEFGGQLSSSLARSMDKLARQIASFIGAIEPPPPPQNAQSTSRKAIQARSLDIS
jgi:hypothetical protein